MCSRYHLVVAVVFWVRLCSTPSALAQEAPWARWDLHEAVRIGALDGPQALVSVRALILDADDHIYIGEGLVATVRVYDTSGRLIRRIGGRGSGPGEFESVDGLYLHGDELVVEDFALQRYSRFNDAGEVIETFRAPPGAFINIGVFEDGSVLARPRSNIHAQPGGPRMPLVRLTRVAGGIRIDTVATQQAQGSGACVGRRIRVCLGTDIGTADIVRMDPHGRTFAVASNLRAETAGRRQFMVAKMSPSGDTVMKSYITYTPTAVPRSYADSLANFWTELLLKPPGNRPPMTRQEAAVAVRDGLQVPAYYSPVKDLLISRGGDIWLEVFSASDQQTWIVLDSRGRRKADVVGSPAGFTAHYVGAGMVWGTVKDEFDVPYVVGLKIRGITESLKLSGL